MTTKKLRTAKTGLVAIGFFASILSFGLLAPQKAEAAGWSYVNTWSGKKYYACKYSNTRGRVKVVNTTSSRKTFKISGSTYYVAAYNATYVSLTRYYSFDVDGYKFSFRYGYTYC